MMVWPSPKEVMTTQRRAAFTMVDLLVVILIIALLATILLPAIKRVRQAGYLAICTSNMRQIGVLIQCYAANNNYEIPAGYGGFASGAKPKPTAFFRVLIDDQSQTVKLLVNSPVGLAKGNYATDAKLFICPGDFDIVRKSSEDFGYGPNWEDTPPDLRTTSYGYFYVPPSGDFYKYWSVIPGQDQWFPALFKHLERHDIRQAKAAMLAILVERPADPRWVGDSYHPGNGGNVLYLDGHVTWVNRMPREMLPPPVTNGPFAPYDDGTIGVNYIDHAGNL